MHIFFSGIGGTGIGPLALIAKQSGLEVSGSDKRKSQYTQYLQTKGIDLYIGQDKESLVRLNSSKPIDWYVYSSALLLEDPNHPEYNTAKKLSIKTSKRDEFLAWFLKKYNLKLIAFAGTHGKTSSTAMAVWAALELNIPISYSVGAKLSYGEMGKYDSNSQYFVYECDEFDRNFLAFKPEISVLTKVDWDHHEQYPTRDDYRNAFKQFCKQSNRIIAHKNEIDYLNLSNNTNIIKIEENSVKKIKLHGYHNKLNASAVAEAIKLISDEDSELIYSSLNDYPGSNRRFEKLANNIYSDYAHTPEEISATLQLAREINSEIVVVYEPLTNRRQHFMKEKYSEVFKDLKKLYWLPSYLAREDPGQRIIHPQEFIEILDDSANGEVAEYNQKLITNISKFAKEGALVLLLAGGGGNSLDEWARKEFVN